MVTAAERQARVQVHRIRFSGNGTIFTGRVVREDGSETGEGLVCVLPRQLLPAGAAVRVGDVWEIGGRLETYRGEPQIRCTRAALSRPSGANFVRVLSTGARFGGIGPVLAKQLWARFGDEVFAILEQGDSERLKEVLPPAAAQNLVDHPG